MVSTRRLLLSLFISRMEVRFPLPWIAVFSCSGTLVACPVICPLTSVAAGSVDLGIAARSQFVSMLVRGLASS
jgi:hypothetical protein